MAREASLTFSQIITPLPAANPSAFITIGNLVFFKKFNALLKELNSL